MALRLCLLGVIYLCCSSRVCYGRHIKRGQLALLQSSSSPEAYKSLKDKIELLEGKLRKCGSNCKLLLEKLTEAKNKGWGHGSDDNWLEIVKYFEKKGELPKTLDCDKTMLRMHNIVDPMMTMVDKDLPSKLTTAIDDFQAGAAAVSGFLSQVEGFLKQVDHAAKFTDAMIFCMTGPAYFKSTAAAALKEFTDGMDSVGEKIGTFTSVLGKVEKAVKLCNGVTDFTNALKNTKKQANGMLSDNAQTAEEARKEYAAGASKALEAAGAIAEALPFPFDDYTKALFDLASQAPQWMSDKIIAQKLAEIDSVFTLGTCTTPNKECFRKYLCKIIIKNPNNPRFKIMCAKYFDGKTPSALNQETQNCQVMPI